MSMLLSFHFTSHPFFKPQDPNLGDLRSLLNDLRYVCDKLYVFSVAGHCHFLGCSYTRSGIAKIKGQWSFFFFKGDRPTI